ncbi:MAG: hypothetical protein KDC80_21390, partial [Saprospiraceae bacterium]|nr:hypothetical protein [Saprospiraceae bacterium]
MTNFTFKTIVLVVFSFLLTTASFAQKPVSAPASLSPSIGKQAALNKFLSDNSVDPNDTIAVIDTVMLLEKSSSDMHFRIDPKEGATMWRYRPLGDLPADAEVQADLWTSGMSMDTCCISLENLDAETEYVVQFGRMGIGQTDPAIWYSMVEMTRCMGPSLDQLKLVGLDHSSASMMVEMESEAFDWVLKRVGSSTARHIETTTNNIEWTNLPANTAHECRVRYMCGGIWSDYSSADIFTTNEYEEIHCDTLTNDHVYTSDINTNYVKLNCSMAGNKYSWGLREAGSNSWTIFTTETDHYNWTSLKSGKTYEYKVKVECQEDSWSDWSNTHYFTTKEDYGNSCYAPTSSYMTVKNISYNSASTYCVMDGYEYHWAIKPYGSNVWIDHTTTKNYHHWTGLHYNTKYEYKVKVKCHSGSWTGWSNSYWFTTHDHYQNTCTTPQGHHMSVKDLTYHSAITHCSVDGYEYHWMLKEYGSSHWVDYTSHDNFYSWTNLHYNTKYEYKVKVKCHSGSWTGWSN